MPQKTQNQRTGLSSQRAIGLLILLWLAYAGLTLTAPATHAINQYRINLTQVSLLRIGILLPLLFIWIAAVFAATRFRHYTRLVTDSLESRGFKHLAMGLLMLCLVLIIPSFINLVANYFPHSGPVEKYVTITRTYTTIVLYLLAFWHLLQSSRTIRTAFGMEQTVGWRLRLWLGVVVFLLAIAYAWAIFHNQFRTFSNDPLIKPTYFLPDWLIVSTIFLPYVLVWLWGAWAASNMHAIAARVQGSIYKRAFRSVAHGIATIVTLLVGLQFLSQASTVFGHASLKGVLLILYILIIGIAAGYLFLARAAKQLASIEEV